MAYLLVGPGAHLYASDGIRSCPLLFRNALFSRKLIHFLDLHVRMHSTRVETLRMGLLVNRIDTAKR